MKRIKKTLCLLLLVFSVMLVLPVTANASTNGHTQQEAMAWVRAQVGKKLDYDNFPPPPDSKYQCVDLIKFYYAFLGCGNYGVGNACDYATNALPSGWSRYKGVQPQPGDILVYSGNTRYPYGHVAIYESDYVTYHQNLGGHPYVERYTGYYNGLANPCWGVIRPDFTAAPVQATWQGPSVSGITKTNAIVSGKVDFSQTLQTTAAGLRLYDNDGNLLASYKPDATNYRSTYVTFNFNINTELNYTLVSGKTYKVQFYTVSGSKEYKSPITAFTTAHTHSFTSTVYKPTCTEQGYTKYNCACGYSYTAGYVDALGHNVVTDARVEPTCTNDGLTEGSHCDRCHTVFVEQETIYALGHNVVTDARVEPTCTNDGLTEGSHCDRCHTVFVEQETIYALGHDYEYGYCTRCGREDPYYKTETPGDLRANYVTSSGKPYVQWSYVSSAVRYDVYRSGSKSGTYKYIGSATSTTYTDTSAKPGYYFYYKVKAINAGGVGSDDSVAVSALCHCAQPVLNSAQYLSSSGKPYLSWETVSGAGKYYVYRSGTKYGTYKYIGTASKNSYSDVSASPGYTYFYKVEAVSKVRTSANSVTSTVLATTCHCAKPVVRTDYLASSGKPYLKWSAVTGASKYHVYRAGSQNGTYKYIGSTTKTNYTDTTASAGYAYYYKVKAVSKVKAAANSAYSTVVKATCHCAKPVVKIALTQKGDPKLTWNTVAGASKYEVYRATSKNGTYTKMFTTTNRSYTNTNARPGTTYYYKVKAISRVRSTANSSYSVVKSIRAR